MKTIIKSISIIILLIILMIIFAGIYKFNFTNDDIYVQGHNWNLYTIEEYEKIEKSMIWKEIKEHVPLEWVDVKNNDLKVFLNHYNKINWDNEKTNFKVATMDLNNDDNNEFFVALEWDYWCGTGGCTTLLLNKKESKYNVLNDFWVQQGISLLKDKTNNWNRIYLHSNDRWTDYVVEMAYQLGTNKYDYWKN